LKRFALLVVDVQNDFCPGGALAIKEGDQVVPLLNTLVREFVELGFPVFFSRDWHPSNHCSFKMQGGTWPPHCVQGSNGAAFHPKMIVPKGSTIISKGTEPDQEAYSAFQGTDLASRLRKSETDVLVVGGLATDYCVLNSVLDSVKSGLETLVVSDCVRGVNVKKSDSARAMKEMRDAGAQTATSDALMKSLRRVALLSSS
jgi:nicotinamidase/pyrazinamidase